MEAVVGGASLGSPPPLHLLNGLGYDADGGGEGDQEQQVEDAETLRLEDVLQRREVDDE